MKGWGEIFYMRRLIFVTLSLSMSDSYQNLPKAKPYILKSKRLALGSGVRGTRGIYFHGKPPRGKDAKCFLCQLTPLLLNLLTP